MSAVAAHDFASAFRRATGLSPYPWQARLATQADPGQVIVAETGTGKTEAVLLDWLWRRRLSGDEAERRRTPRRLVFTLPMRALVEQTLARVRGILDRLERSGLLDPSDPVRCFSLMGGAADDAWVLHPAADQVLVGTVDMLLSRALNRGYGRARAALPMDFGLINTDTQFVLDEVQLLDVAVATSRQLAGLRADAGLGKTPLPSRTMWMSATLNPAWLETTDYPAPESRALVQLGSADEDGPLRARLTAAKRVVRLEADPRDAGSVARAVAEAHERARRHLGAGQWLTIAMANTVKRALALHEELARLNQGAELILLHSRFRPPDRKRLVARLNELPPPGGRIIVTTQVIEAGIDLDAAALVTELAPWASIVQRAGRLNRAGSREDAELIWLDPPVADLGDDLAAPYEQGALHRARQALRELEGEGFSPKGLRERRLQHPDREHDLIGPRPRGLLLRRPDLLELFDTDPTLDGDDADVSPFIRSGEDVDVGVVWRELTGSEPDVRAPGPAHEEVCPVPVGERREIAKLRPWRWSYVRRCWERIADAREIRPGELLLVDSARGGYDPEVGWSPTSRTPVAEFSTPEGDPPESDASDTASGAAAWITIAEHTDDVVAELERDLERLSLEPQWTAALRTAARLHDAGKAHPRFQERLREAAVRSGAAGPPDLDTLWAKAPAQLTGRQRVFRHEVASALLALKHTTGETDASLVAYLVAAHHGKLRLAPRVAYDELPDRPGAATCLGVTDGDPVPAPDASGVQRPIELGGGVSLPPCPALDLSPLAIGRFDGQPVWIERTLDLLERLGPFTLAYLEALLRAADQRASALERKQQLPAAASGATP